MEVEAEAEAVEATAPSHNIDLIAKGKRTKRRRPNSPVSFTINAAAPTQSHHLPPPSPAFYATSSEESTTTEEVDTARCLILLSRGPSDPPNNKQNRRSDAATTSYGGGGASMYTCKTCNKSFRSFQALGGHRASHTKPKNEKKAAIFSDEEDFPSPSSSNIRFSPNSVSLQLSSVSTATFLAAMPPPRTHECSYCGAEFTSGQALGGHMRKHRGAAPVGRSSPKIQRKLATDEVEVEQKEEKMAGNWLSLDLNLPAPDDEREKARARIGFSTID